MPRRRTSVKQMKLLLDFAETHRDIALGRTVGNSRELWKSLAIQLNLVPEGITKTPHQWRRYWIEFKAKTKAKAADCRRSSAIPGGPPNRLKPLSVTEERVLALIDPLAFEKLPGAQQIEVDVPTEEDSEPAILELAESEPILLSSLSNSVSSEGPDEAEWLEEDNLSPIEQQPPPQTTPSPPPVQRLVQRSSPPVRGRSLRYRRRIRRDEKMPRWVYNVEMRRVATEEQRASAMEEMVNIMRQIWDDVHSYVHRKN